MLPAAVRTAVERIDDWLRGREIVAPSEAVRSIARALLKGQSDSRRVILVGDPVILALVDWWSRGGRGELEFPDVDQLAARSNKGGWTVVPWEALPGNPSQLVEQRWPGFFKQIDTLTLSKDQLDAAYRGANSPEFLRPFHRQMLRRKWSELPDRSRPIILFHHIPKCAGMTIFHHLNSHLAWNDELIHLDARAERDVLAAGVVPFDRKDPREVARARIVFGHDVSVKHAAYFPDRQIRYVTCLRDPASRFVSHYNWEMNQRALSGIDQPDFEDWYAVQEPNWIIRWLCRVFLGEASAGARGDRLLMERVQQVLNSFWIVATTPQVESKMEPLTDLLGLPPVKGRSNAAGEAYPKKFELTNEWRKRIEQEHRYDTELYHWALEA